MLSNKSSEYKLTENKELFNSKLDKFIAKRAAVLLIVLTAAGVLFFRGSRWLTLAGLFTGAFLSIGRFISKEWIFRKILKLNEKKAAAYSAAIIAISQLVLFPIIVLTYFINIWFFYGLIAGILVIPLVIMLNSITEAFGITKNNFE